MDQPKTKLVFWTYKGTDKNICLRLNSQVTCIPYFYYQQTKQFKKYSFESKDFFFTKQKKLMSSGIQNPMTEKLKKFRSIHGKDQNGNSKRLINYPTQQLLSSNENSNVFYHSNSTSNLTINKDTGLNNGNANGNFNNVQPKNLSTLSNLRLGATSHNSHAGISSTIIFTKSNRKNRNQSNSNSNALNSNNNVNRRSPQKGSIEQLKIKLREKDRQLQQRVEKIVIKQKQYTRELEQMDEYYQEQISRLHSILKQSVQRNKQLQQKINIITALGLEQSFGPSNEPVIEENSSMLLNDLDDLV